ncbi:MAG: hypothetical protein J6W81_00435 [Lentisphaeria bacterium]|nr:hypothetical protein [Lentisphaeria bacterium]
MPDSGTIKNIISLRDYYKDLHFGIAAGKLSLSAAHLEECTVYNAFDALEIRLEQLEALSAPERKKYLSKFKICHCGNLLAPALTTLITGAGRMIQKEFTETCSQLFEKLGDIQYASLDFSLSQVLGDPESEAVLRKLLHGLHPALVRTGKTLLLSYSLPLNGSENSRRLTAFLRNLMIPDIKLRLEIHPHDLKPDFNPEELAGTLRLETRSVLFCYNADAGNHLLRAHVAPWLRYFALTGFKGPFLLSPFSRENSLCPVECAGYAKLAEDFKK